MNKALIPNFSHKIGNQEGLQSEIDKFNRYKKFLEKKDMRAGLMSAIMQNMSNEIITLLIETGEDPHINFESKANLLHIAAEYHITPEVITTLALNSVDINAINVNGETPLMKAVMYNPNVQVVEAILDNFAFIDKQNYRGETALIYAAKHGTNPENFIALLENRADKTIKDIDGKTALDYIKKNENLINEVLVKAFKF